MKRLIITGKSGIAHRVQAKAKTGEAATELINQAKKVTTPFSGVFL